ETSDAQAFAAFERASDTRSALRFVDWLERRWRTAFAAVALLALFSFAFLEWGVPLIAKRIADDVPQSWRRAMTDKSIDAMLRLEYLNPSQLEQEKADAFRAHFQRALELARADVGAFDYELRLYKGAFAVGANAFAFPSGVIIATDQFVALCESDEQAIAVFL